VQGLVKGLVQGLAHDRLLDACLWCTQPACVGLPKDA
jgi:hypothetical protein